MRSVNHIFEIAKCVKFLELWHWKVDVYDLISARMWCLRYGVNSKQTHRFVDTEDISKCIKLSILVKNIESEINFKMAIEHLAFCLQLVTVPDIETKHTLPQHSTIDMNAHVHNGCIVGCNRYVLYSKSNSVIFSVVVIVMTHNAKWDNMMKFCSNVQCKRNLLFGLMLIRYFVVVYCRYETNYWWTASIWIHSRWKL